MLTVPIPINNVVQVTGDHFTFITGTCLACNRSGRMERDKLRGLPHGSSRESTVWLVHAEMCPMNRHLNQRGNPRELATRLR
jgi:hypothetical protein